MNRSRLIDTIELAVEKGRERLIELCTRLINIPSVTGNEGEVQSEVYKIMREIGMEIDMWEPDDIELRQSDLFVETGESFRGRPVVAGIWRGSGQGKSLLINGHVDVVTEHPVEKWTSNPFQSVIKDGKIYGRGASDMKSGLAMALFAAEVIKKIGKALGGTLTIISVPGEENGGNGTVASILRGYTRADAAIFPEPTSNQIQPAHRGAAFWRICIEGKGTHGGTKYKGVSAIEKGMLIAEKLRELEQYRNEIICKKHPMYSMYPISAPVTLGIFKGGQFTSSVAEECLLEGCIEYVPGEKSTEVKRMFEQAVMRACDEDAWLKEHRPKIEWFGLLYEPAQTDENHPFICTLKECFREILHQEPVVNGFEAGTDMRLLANNYGVPSVIFGPGNIAVAHAPNEYVEIEQVVKGAKVLALLIAEWCGLE